jgi:hypothetical protein
VSGVRSDTGEVQCLFSYGDTGEELQCQLYTVTQVRHPRAIPDSWEHCAIPKGTLGVTKGGQCEVLQSWPPLHMHTSSPHPLSFAWPPFLSLRYRTSKPEPVNMLPRTQGDTGKTL